MMIGAQRALLSGGRWHLQHGPIDIVIHAEGQAVALQAAHQAAWGRFETVLAELVAELPKLRLPVAGVCPVQGLIARRMWAACAPLVGDADGHLTPMAAVAGSVAQELVAAYQRPGIDRASVNNGGDIALHLAPGHQTRIGLYADLARFDAAAAARTAAGTLRTDLDFAVHAGDPVRGVATSGWRGRSHSRGIADSVTVLAATAAMADAAATVIANAVDLVDDPQAARAGIVRRPANSQRDDSDLGTIAVTVKVPPCPPCWCSKRCNAAWPAPGGCRGGAWCRRRCWCVRVLLCGCQRPCRYPCCHSWFSNCYIKPKRYPTPRHPATPPP